MVEEKEVRCQNCKTHKNNPSVCTLTGKYVGRKHKCNDFKKK